MASGQIRVLGSKCWRHARWFSTILDPSSPRSLPGEVGIKLIGGFQPHVSPLPTWEAPWGLGWAPCARSQDSRVLIMVCHQPVVAATAASPSEAPFGPLLCDSMSRFFQLCLDGVCFPEPQAALSQDKHGREEVTRLRGCGRCQVLSSALQGAGQTRAPFPLFPGLGVRQDDHK